MSIKETRERLITVSGTLAANLKALEALDSSGKMTSYQQKQVQLTTKVIKRYQEIVRDALVDLDKEITLMATEDAYEEVLISSLEAVNNFLEATKDII